MSNWRCVLLLVCLVVLYAILFVWIAVVAVVLRRATSGISGRSSRQRQAAGITFATIYVLVYVFAGALDSAEPAPRSSTASTRRPHR